MRTTRLTLSLLSDREPTTADTLVVLLHAYTLSAASMASVAQAARNAYATQEKLVDLLVPELPIRSIFSCVDPNVLTRGIIDLIDAWWEGRARAGDGGYRRLVFVGHSLGALLARKAYVAACGERPGAPLELPLRLSGPRAWTERVGRIVLLAGMNRGWRISHHLSIPKAIVWSFGVLVGRVMWATMRKWPLILTIRRGAEFVTQLRIQWIMLRRPAADSNGSADGRGRALTIQLLGSVDDMVAPDDNVDLEAGRDFIYLDVPYSGHGNVIQMDDPRHGDGRRNVFQLALTGSLDELRAAAVLPEDSEPEPPRLDVTDVIFVIHGIRDLGYWTQKIARRAKAIGTKKERTFATVTSTYGYLPMLPFLLPWQRRIKVEWLMDQYAEALSLYPCASFSFVGHSNGTYLLARALEIYPCCQFRHVVFAGSVVRRDYRWERFLPETGTGQVRAVLNLVASRDWVVAWFPKLFQTLRLQDLGSAGHDGFESGALRWVRQIGFVEGAHSAALREDNWEAISRFVVHGPETNDIPVVRRRAAWVAIPGAFPPIVWAVGIALIVLLGGLVRSAAVSLGAGDGGQALALAAYAFGLWLVATRV